MILDTGVLIRLEREVKKRVIGPAKRFPDPISHERICMTPTIAGEFCSGTSMADRKRWTDALLPYEMLGLTSETSWTYGIVFRNLAKRAGKIGANDMSIAATALTHNLPVATGNVREFTRVEGLIVLPV